MEYRPKAWNAEELIQDFRNRGNSCFKNKNFQEAIHYYAKGLLFLIEHNLYQ
jgi:hypothetical protein